MNDIEKISSAERREHSSRKISHGTLCSDHVESKLTGEH